MCYKWRFDKSVCSVNEMLNKTECWFDPQGVAAQTVGYVKVVLLIIHAIPSIERLWRKKDASVIPTWSVVVRTTMAVLSVISGVMICQIPEMVGGGGALIIFSVLIAGMIKFDKKRNKAPNQDAENCRIKEKKKEDPVCDQV